MTKSDFTGFEWGILSSKTSIEFGGRTSRCWQVFSFHGVMFIQGITISIFRTESQMATSLVRDWPAKSSAMEDNRRLVDDGSMCQPVHIFSSCVSHIWDDADDGDVAAATAAAAAAADDDDDDDDEDMVMSRCRWPNDCTNLYWNGLQPQTRPGQIAQIPGAASFRLWRWAWSYIILPAKSCLCQVGKKKVARKIAIQQNCCNLLCIYVYSCVINVIHVAQKNNICCVYTIVYLHLSISLSINLYIYPSIYLSIYLSNLSIYLSI